MSGKAGCGWIIFATLVTLPLALYEGWVASVLWAWFVVPTFDLPELSVATATGIVFLVSMVTSSSGGRIADEAVDIDPIQRFSTALSVSIIAPTAALFFGWLIHLVAS